MIVTDFNLYEQYIKEQHDKGLKVGLVVETNRLYKEEYHQQRIDHLREKTDKIIYFFAPYYECLYEIELGLARKMYGNKPKSSIYDVVTNRLQYDIDLMFIPSAYIPYTDEIKLWLNRNAPLIDKIDEIDALTYIRGCYATECYLGLMWKEKVDLVITCPFELKYNYLCYWLVNHYGVKFDLLSWMSLDGLLKGK
jgi:hypothetical protein